MSAETSGRGTRVDAAGVVARARAAADADGRLPAPDLTTWETFPFEGDLLVKRPADPVLPEPPRRGEDGAAACPVCARGDEQYVWTSDRWRADASAGAGPGTDVPAGTPGTPGHR